MTLYQIDAKPMKEGHLPKRPMSKSQVDYSWQLNNERGESLKFDVLGNRLRVTVMEREATTRGGEPQEGFRCISFQVPLGIKNEIINAFIQAQCALKHNQEDDRDNC